MTEQVQLIAQWWLLIGAILWVLAEWIKPDKETRIWFYCLCLILSALLWPFFILALIRDWIRK